MGETGHPLRSASAAHKKPAPSVESDIRHVPIRGPTGALNSGLPHRRSTRTFAADITADAMAEMLPRHRNNSDRAVPSTSLHRRHLTADKILARHFGGLFARKCWDLFCGIWERFPGEIFTRDFQAGSRAKSRARTLTQLTKRFLRKRFFSQRQASIPEPQIRAEPSELLLWNPTEQAFAQSFPPQLNLSVPLSNRAEALPGAAE